MIVTQRNLHIIKRALVLGYSHASSRPGRVRLDLTPRGRWSEDLPPSSRGWAEEWPCGDVRHVGMPLGRTVLKPETVSEFLTRREIPQANMEFIYFLIIYTWNFIAGKIMENHGTKYIYICGIFQLATFEDTRGPEGISNMKMIEPLDAY